MKLILVARHLYDRLMLWSAELNAHSAQTIALEAEQETLRAAQLLARNMRLLDDARMRAQNSGWRIERRERLLSLGVKP